jgi:hypothetical protein
MQITHSDTSLHDFEPANPFLLIGLQGSWFRKAARLAMLLLDLAEELAQAV